MDWKPEKLCSSRGDYELLVEKAKHSYHCEDKGDSWKWRVVHSGVVVSQGTAQKIENAQKLAESNIPAKN